MELDEGDLVTTTDFRRVCASVLGDWLDVADPADVRSRFEPPGLLEGSA